MLNGPGSISHQQAMDKAREEYRKFQVRKDVQRAIDSRHPFGTFKEVMAYHGRLNDWYQYRDTRYMDYVRRELDLEWDQTRFKNAQNIRI